MKTLCAGILVTASFSAVAQSSTSTRETRVTTALETYRNQPVQTNENSKYVRCDSVEKDNGDNKSTKVECTKIEEISDSPVLVVAPKESEVTSQKVTTETKTRVISQ
jgi:hypothetical protein